MSSIIDDFVLLFPDEMHDALTDWIVTSIGSDADASTLENWMLGLGSSAFGSGIGLEMSDYLVDQGYIAADIGFGTVLANLVENLNSVHVVADNYSGSQPFQGFPTAELVVQTDGATDVSSGPGDDLFYIDWGNPDSELNGKQGIDTYFQAKPDAPAQISECLIFDFQGATVLASALPDAADKAVYGFKASEIDTMTVSTGNLDILLKDGTHYSTMFMYSDGTPVDEETITARTQFLPEEGSSVTYGAADKPLLIVAEDVDPETPVGTGDSETFFVTPTGKGTIEMGGGDDRAVVDLNRASADTITIKDGTGSDSVVVLSGNPDAKVNYIVTPHDGALSANASGSAAATDTIMFADLSFDAQITDLGGGDYEASGGGVTQRFSLHYDDNGGTSLTPSDVDFTQVLDGSVQVLTLSIVEL